MAPFDTTPQTTRRALNADEISRLLNACAPHRKLLLETAFLSGLRVGELRNLTRDHLDLERCGLHLDAESGRRIAQKTSSRFLERWRSICSPLLYLKSRTACTLVSTPAGTLC